MAKEKNPHAVALSKLGAKKGGKARAAALSAEKRREIARKASLARWAKEKRKPKLPKPLTWFRERPNKRNRTCRREAREQVYLER